MTLKTLFNRSAATVAALTVAGGVAISAQAQSTALRGQVQIDGSSTVFPIAEAIAEEFPAANPAVRVSVGFSGSGGGFKRFCNGEIDLANASRPIKDSEREACAAAGLDYMEIGYKNSKKLFSPKQYGAWRHCDEDDLKLIVSSSRRQR